MLVDRRRYLLKEAVRVERFLTWFMPRPDLYIILDAHSSYVISRKAELRPDELERQRCSWLHIAGTLPRAIVVNAEAPPAAVLDSAIYAIKMAREGALT